jgi:hypothetical protein
VTILPTAQNAVSKLLLFTDVLPGGTTTGLQTSAGVTYNFASDRVTVPNLLALGTMTGTLNGRASSANQVATATDDTTGQNRWIAFSSSNNASNTPSDLLTASNLTFNPGLDMLTVPNLTVTGTMNGGGGGGGGGGVTITDTTAAGFQKILFTVTPSGGTATVLNTNSGLLCNPGTGSLATNGSITAPSFIGRASSANQVVTATDDTTGQDRWIAFSSSNNASNTPSDLLTASNLTFNPGSDMLTVPNLTVTGTLTGGGGGGGGVTVTNTTTNVSQRLLFTNTASGGTTSALSTSTGLFYWPDSNQLNVPNGLISTANIVAAGQVSAQTFQGNLTGTANVATLVNTVSDDTTNGNQHIAFSTTNNSFNAASTLRTSTNLTYNPFTQRLTVQNLTVTGTLTGGGGGGGGGVTVIDSSSASTHRLLFTSTASGGTTTSLNTDSGLIYNPFTNDLSCGGNMSAVAFVGPLNGTASLANQVVTANDGSNNTRFITFAPSNHFNNAATDILTSSTLRYNPALQLLSVQNLNIAGKVTDQNRQIIRFSRSTNYVSPGFYLDEYVHIGWDSTANEIVIRQPTARPSVYAMGLTATSGTYMSGQNMLLSTTYDDFYFQSGTGQVEFTIISEVDDTHPTYMVRVIFPSGAGTAKIAAIVEKLVW